MTDEETKQADPEDVSAPATSEASPESSVDTSKRSSSDTSAKRYRCRVDFSWIDTAGETSGRLGPGAEVTSERYQELLAAGLIRPNMFEAIERTEE